MNQYLSRALRAAKLDRTLYREAAADPGYRVSAVITVIAYSSFSGIGSFGMAGAAGVNIGMVTTLIGWYVWAFSTYMFGARFFPEARDPVERRAVYRAMGFATAPGMLRLFGLTPGVGGVIVLLVSLWVIVASVVAVKQAFNFSSTGRAVGVCLAGLTIGAFAQIVLLIILFSVFGVSG